MQPSGSADCGITNSVETGLYVSWDKSHLLINDVDNLLRSKYKTKVVRGPHLANNTCELRLAAIQPSGGNFVESKGLLEKYLIMINESKPKAFADKSPEIIDLAKDDEVLVIGNDVTKDKKAPYVQNFIGVSLFKQDKKEKSVEPCKVVSHKDLNYSECSSSTKSVNQSLMKNTAKELSPNFSEKQSSKIKSPFNQEKEKSPEVIEILDDDIIVLDDSFSSSVIKEVGKSEQNNDSVLVIESTLPQPNASSVSSRSESNTCDCIDLVNDSLNDSVQSIVAIDNLSTDIESTNLDTALSSSSSSRSFCGQNLYISSGDKSLSSAPKEGTVTTSSDTAIASNTSTPNTVKKSSKLAYKRPAHLLAPLTTVSPSKAAKNNAQSNIYNPNVESEEKKSGLRPIVIDGNNVAIGHGKGQFSLEGIKICINYFEKRGHRHIKAFLPHYRKNKETFDELHKMERQGTIVITPSRKVDGKVVASYDDRYIVQYAAEVGAVIVSTDNYRDLMDENPSWKETIEKRLLMFTWIDDLLMFPQDPLGRRGPTLDKFLKFPDT